ncbi:preprotein translocase subunit SecG [Corynebacterium nasicanis]
MSVMTLALQIVLVLTAVLMTVFVLLHKGKGGGLSSLFGGGVQSNLSGSTIVEKNLNRYTIIMAVIWIACIVALNLVQAFGG